MHKNLDKIIKSTRNFAIVKTEGKRDTTRDCVCLCVRACDCLDGTLTKGSRTFDMHSKQMWTEK